MNESDFSVVELEVIRCLSASMSIDLNAEKRTLAECGWCDVYDIQYRGQRFEDAMPHLVEVGAVEAFESEASLLGKLYRVAGEAKALGRELNERKWAADVAASYGKEYDDEIPF